MKKIDWITTENPPVSQYLVHVMDEYGNEGYAEAAYFPFTTYQKNGLKGHYNTVLVPCEPYFDGWLILCDKGLDTDIKGNIVKWREIDKD